MERPNDPPAYMMTSLKGTAAQILRGEQTVRVSSRVAHMSSQPFKQQHTKPPGLGFVQGVDETDMYKFLRHSSCFQLLKPAMRACTQCRPPEPRKFMIDFLDRMLQQNAISAQ